MTEPFIGPYKRSIIEQLGCSTEDAAMVEDIMRNHVFHSTLDWQSAAELQRGTRAAWAILEEDRAMFEEYYRGVRKVFEEMKQQEA